MKSSISIAIPDSALGDESTRLDKTRKASVLARACAIFGAKTVYIYADRTNQEDASLLGTVLRYAETPQYLRRRLFPRVNQLKYAGVIHPLQIPSHIVTSDIRKIKSGDIREGLVVLLRGEKFVDIGLGKLISYYGKAKSGSRISVEIKEITPDIKIKEIEKSQITQYWGYETKMRASLTELLRKWQGPVILTSRRGRPYTHKPLKPNTLVVFGTTDRGLYDILGSTITKIQNASVLNFFPNQHSATVRLEEALVGTLAILGSTQRTKTHA